MENKNIIYIPGRGISKAMFAPINPSPRPEMPNTMTISGTFKMKGNTNQLRAMMKPRTERAWNVNIFMDMIREYGCSATMTLTCRNYRAAVLIARRLRKECNKKQNVRKASFKVTRTRYKL